MACVQRELLTKGGHAHATEGLPGRVRAVAVVQHDMEMWVLLEALARVVLDASLCERRVGC